MTRASDLAKLLGAGATINDGTTITTADNTTQLTLTSTDADANAGPVVDLTRDSGSPADADLLGTLRFRADNSAGEVTNYAEIFSRAEDVTDGTEDGKILINTIVGGTERSRLEIDNTAVVINQDSIDSDFRVEGNGDTHALFVQGGSDHVGINNNSPNSSFTGADNLVIGGGSGHTGMTILSGTSSRSSIEFSDGTGSDATKTAGGIRYYHDSNYMRFNTGGGTERMRINENGYINMFAQPVFHVTRVSTQSTSNSINTSTPLEFPSNNAVVSSTHYNHTNHRFTAPVDGKYMFQWGYGTNIGTAGVYRTFLWKNGSIITETQLRNDSSGMTGYAYASRSAILTLSASDYIHLNSSQDNGTAFYADNQLRIFFLGYLLA